MENFWKYCLVLFKESDDYLRVLALLPQFIINWKEIEEGAVIYGYYNIE